MVLEPRGTYYPGRTVFSPPDALLVGVGGPDPRGVGEDPLHDVGVLSGVVNGGEPGVEFSRKELSLSFSLENHFEFP